MEQHTVRTHRKPAMSDVRNTRARDEVVAEILARIEAGASVHSVLGADRPKGFPTERTWWRWINEDVPLRERYDRAIAARADLYAEQIAAIADEEPPFEQTQFGKKRDAAHVAWQKNRIDARKWLASKLVPKKYGDRTVIAGDADNPIAVDDPKSILARRLATATPGDRSPRGDQ
jgi:hypothetical protein